MFLQTTVNTVMCCLPFLREDQIVLQDCVFDPIHGQQHLLAVLLSVCLNLTDLGPMGSPPLPSIIDLKERKRQ